MRFRVLHVDKDSEVREFVALALGRDPAITLTGCASAAQALSIVMEQAPDLIVCEAALPGIDGPTMLACLRERTSTARIPVVLTATNGEPRRLQSLQASGAAAVITKPLDPVLVADTVRNLLRAAKLASVGSDFAQRMQHDAATLAEFRQQLRGKANLSAVLEGLQNCAHKLAGAAGVFNFPAVSRAAATLEDAVVDRRAGKDSLGQVEAKLEALLECLQCA